MIIFFKILLSFVFLFFQNEHKLFLYLKTVIKVKKQVGSLREKRGASISPHPPTHPNLSTLGVLHFKKSDRSGEKLVFNKKSSLVLEELESWQFISAMNCEK